MLKLHRRLEAAGVPLALAIGNFDGVHRGHQALLTATVQAAKERGLAPAAMSFHPLPREFFSRGRGGGVEKAGAVEVPRLMSVSEKLGAWAGQGVAHAYIPRFDARFAAQSPEAFMAALQAMDVRWLAVGSDFHFGARRAGNVDTLREAQGRHGFTVETIAEVADDETDAHGRVSSTAVRAALAAGELSHAAAMLGASYRIIGRVTHGKKLGRTLGFPTANVALAGRRPALGGVFAVQCRLVTRGLEGVAGGAGGPVLNGVANLGTNPVVSSENRPHLEVFLFDYAADLYGKRLSVEFIEKIRDERNFANLDALVAQMRDDEQKARSILTRMSDGHQGH